MYCIAQPIKVDSRSLVDLKAIVYAKEQKVRPDGGGSGSGLRGLRGKRPSGEKDGGGRKDPFARSNKGVKDRSQRDEEERMTTSKKKTAAQRIMAAKSSLYEKMGMWSGATIRVVAFSMVFFSPPPPTSPSTAVLALVVGARTSLNEAW